MSALLVLSTASKVSEAKKIARTLVTEHLAACVNVLPKMTAYYWWNGSVHSDPEILLLIKTTSARLSALTRRIHALHSYDVPEVIAVPITAGSPRYLRWLYDATRLPKKR